MTTKIKSLFRAVKSFQSANNLLIALLPLIFVGLACSKFIIPQNVNLFEGNNTQEAVAKIKQKIGADKVKVINAEIRQNEMNNPKNIDEYTFEKGSVSGPKPVEAMSFGNLEMTADKYHTTDLDAINFAAIPETIRQAIARAASEGAEVELISMDHQNAEMTNPQLKEQRKSEYEKIKVQVKEKEKECFNSPKFPQNCLNEATELRKKEQDLRFSNIGNIKEWDLAWRIFIRGTRARKDFWADKQGKILDNPFGQ